MVGGHDVSSLMMPTLSGGERNEFGKEEGTRLPLLLPKVMEGRPIVSQSLLFSLPAEILGDIMDLLVDDKAALSALALVNSDCRQLARSCQFADVCFDYGPTSDALLSHLVEEGRHRRNPNIPGNTVHPPFIGSCIRRVTVRSRRDFAAHKHRDIYNSIWGDTAESITPLEREEMRKTATDYYFGTHYTSLVAVLRHSMPHVEAILWYDIMCLDDTFFKAVTELPIHHLKISKAYIGDPYCLKSLPPFAMSLKSLFLHVSACIDDVHEDDANNDPTAWENLSITPFMKSILQRCSATLERLTLVQKTLQGSRSFSFGHEKVDFGRLQYLNLSYYHDHPDTGAWCSLLSAPLRHLALPSRPTESLIQSLDACQPLRDLETLVVSCLDYKAGKQAPPILDFISVHPHIRKLCIGNTDSQLMESYLVPLLSDGRWSNLTSLSLEWRGPGTAEETEPNVAEISAESLAAIGNIKSLQQLRLSAGQAFGWRHQWLIDHDLVRSGLRGLASLKRLALSRDTYTIPKEGFETRFEHYYEYRWVRREEQDDAMRRPDLDTPRPPVRTEDGLTDDLLDVSDFDLGKIWERAHRNRMLLEAERYSHVLPSLEWIYCGQWPMGFRNVQTPSGVGRISVPLSTERDSCRTLLGRMFAMGEDGD
ncbi:hypothetical protein TgHK011_006763 [Trichoderma gracile]|nr:hypothetical protein TgHK011_006763 [Trichoderma gracile]